MRYFHLFALFILLALPMSQSIAAISEGQLATYTGSFWQKVAADNPGQGGALAALGAAELQKGRARIMLREKMGLFYYESVRQGYILEKTSLSLNGAHYCLFLVFKQQTDGRRYTLFLDYTIEGGIGKLQACYYSAVIEDERRSVFSFFNER